MQQKGAVLSPKLRLILSQSRSRRNKHQPKPLFHHSLHTLRHNIVYLRVLRFKKNKPWNKQQWIVFDPAEASWLWEMKLPSHYSLSSFFSTKRERLTWWRVCFEASHSCQLQSAYSLSPFHFVAVKKSRKMGEREWGETLTSPISITQSAPQHEVSPALLAQTTAGLCKKPLEQQHICNGTVSLGLELHQGTAPSVSLCWGF